VRETGSREDKRCWNRTRRSAGDFFFGLVVCFNGSKEECALVLHTRLNSACPRLARLLSVGRARDHPVMEIVPNKALSLSLSLSLSLATPSPVPRSPTAALEA